LQYFGGKHRISKELAAFIQPLVTGSYVEPFCGACWVGLRIKAESKTFADINPDLILMYQELQRGWEPPVEINENDYRDLKDLPPGLLPERAFAGFGCSFSGRFFEGYARNGRGTNYAISARNSLLSFRMKTTGCTFVCSSYASLDYPPNSVVYCDPPYEGKKKFSGTPGFDMEKFWEWVRLMSQAHIVLVSEYKAPGDFNILWEKESKLEIRNQNGRETRTERLFCYGK
jgi:DNA adenine methylase